MWEVQIGKHRTIKVTLWHVLSIQHWDINSLSCPFPFTILPLVMPYQVIWPFCLQNTRSVHDLVGDQGYDQNRKSLNSKVMTPGKPLVWAPPFQPPLGSRPELRDTVQASGRSVPESSSAGGTESGHSHNPSIRVMEKSSGTEFIKATVISPIRMQQNAIRLQSHNKNHSMQRTSLVVQCLKICLQYRRHGFDPWSGN